LFYKRVLKNKGTIKHTLIFPHFVIDTDCSPFLALVIAHKYYLYDVSTRKEINFLLMCHVD